MNIDRRNILNLASVLLCLVLGSETGKSEVFSYTFTPTYQVDLYSSGGPSLGSGVSEITFTGDVLLPSVDQENFVINGISLYLTLTLGGAAWDNYLPDRQMDGWIVTTVSLFDFTDSNPHSATGVRSTSLVSYYDDTLVFAYDGSTSFDTGDPEVFAILPFEFNVQVQGYTYGVVPDSFNRFAFITNPVFTAVYDVSLVSPGQGDPLPADEIAEFSYSFQQDGEFPAVPDSNIALPSYIPVPEPGSVLLLGIASFVLAFRSRKRS